ncbi:MULTISPECIES: DEAD/DEAH box helicase [unclassified Desulfovibrio]|uniref:DEAD/DEAH box helicase n=1 Tax=unclassified Desulfovibrio TaxID=2593640 RepID=UPI0013EAEB2B|nr:MULTISPECIES: DEAD/DEAH box helicase [unclassified Desulfovibrio]
MPEEGGAPPLQGRVGEYIAALLASPRLGRQVTYHRVEGACEADYTENRRPWPAAVARLLGERGIRLYSHQALATDHIRAGHSVVVATPTASGKSLIYNLPVLERHLLDPDARALYLFPLKALAQDQLAALNGLAAAWPEDARPTAALYDGDTSDHFRRKIRRDPPTVLISNPEMLHLAMLPHHEQWAVFFAGLTHVVVDEAHTYRGVFGSHMAQVFRRLNRVAARYGARPTYVFCTATVGNPGELAAGLMGAAAAEGDDSAPASPGEAPVVITRSGAPRGPRHFVFLDPEQSPSTAAIDLLKAALARNLRTIVYCRSRRMTELVSLWAGSQAGAYKDRISSYRAGFLPEERRAIEARMASGELLAVVSTSALELGIDIGGLDVCILVGYPGTVMQTLQRGGRVGRARQESAVILVAGEDALDQYFVRNPEDFFSRPPERAVVNPDNEVIVARHLECAAAEIPLTAADPWLNQPGGLRALAALRDQGLLLQSADGGQWLAARKRPQRHVDLRGAGQAMVIEDTGGAVIGTVDGFRAWRETHPGAVYLHRGRSYVVKELDAGRGRILVEPARPSWFTRSRGQKSTDILEETGRRAFGRALVCRGRLRITERITGYEKRAANGNRLLTVVPLDVPPQVFETEGFWYVIPEPVRTSLEARFLHFMGSIHALEHAAIGLLPLLVMADRNDFGGISIPLHPQLGHAAVFIYDGLPGGAGLTREAFGDAGALLAAVRRAIAACPCLDGCPSCVHSPKCGSGNRPISKEGALALLEELLAPGDEGEKLAERLRMTPAPDRLAPEFVLPSREPEAPARGDALRVELPGTHAPRSPAASMPTGLAPPEHYVVVDVETRRSAAEVGGWGLARKMGVSVAVLYDSRDDAYHAFRQEELAGLFERLSGAALVVGFNSVRFDYAVLAPFAPASLPHGADLRALPSLDLLLRIHERLGYRVSLGNLGEATLGEPKSADGLQALKWWKEGRLEDIAAYCRKDVELTRRLYLFGLENGYVLFSNKAGQRARVPVDFRPRG